MYQCSIIIYTEKDGELGSLLRRVFQVVLDPVTLEVSVVGKRTYESL